MSAAVAAAGLLPDPPYLAIPVGGVFGGLLWSTWKWLTEYDPNLPEAWVRGNLVGAGIAALLLPVVLTAGVH